jgi:hypothetical protein
VEGDFKRSGRKIGGSTSLCQFCLLQKEHDLSLPGPLLRVAFAYDHPLQRFIADSVALRALHKECPKLVTPGPGQPQCATMFTFGQKTKQRRHSVLVINLWQSCRLSGQGTLHPKLHSRDMQGSPSLWEDMNLTASKKGARGPKLLEGAEDFLGP